MSHVERKSDNVCDGTLVFSPEDLRRYLIVTDSTVYVVRTKDGELFIFWYTDEGDLFGITPGSEVENSLIGGRIYDESNFPMLVIHHGEVIEPVKGVQ